ncbi:hypothetical protein Tco_1122263 [Tanacetum coccineum]|uniref:Uncharacterized protein n=1 Tax=Tanacetum coccineum TaxID=301880 RepID=A0ABQ5J2N7_9ASTR
MNINIMQLFKRAIHLICCGSGRYSILEITFSTLVKCANVVWDSSLKGDTGGIIDQYQNEVNDIRAERIAKSANPLALLAAAQPYSDNYYQAPKPQRSTVNCHIPQDPSASTLRDKVAKRSPRPVYSSI